MKIAGLKIRLKIKKSAYKRLISAAAAAWIFLACAMPAHARIIFQDDSAETISSETIQIGAGKSGAANTAITFGADSTPSENGNITWNISTNSFSVDHTVNITGGLSATGNVTLNAGANSLDFDATSFTLDTTAAFSIDGVGASNVTTNSGALTLSTTTSGAVAISSADNVNLTSGAGDDITLNSGDDILLDDAQLSSAVQLTDTASALAVTFGTSAIIDAINSLTLATAGNGASNVGLETGSLTNVTPASDDVQAALEALDAKAHTGNADTGTSQDSFKIDSDDSASSIKLSFGSALTKILEYDTSNVWFNLSNRLNIAGAGGVDGIKITTRAGAGDSEQAQIEIRNSANSSVFSVDEDGDVTLSGTVDGRDISTDGSTLDSHTAATQAHGATGAVVGTTNTQTLTNKTIATLDNAIITFDNDNAGAGANIDIVANQGSGADGTIRYNATTKTWQISNDGGAFADIGASSSGTLNQAYNSGGAGAGRTITTNSGAVKLNATPGTTAPLELTPLSAAPSTGLAAGQLMAIDDMLYQYNSSRSKWLSVGHTMPVYSRASADGDYLNLGDAIGTNTGFIIPRKGTVMGLGVTIG